MYSYSTVFCKGSLCVYCFILRRYPAVHVFYIDHRNDIVVNAFGLAMSIIGSRVEWFADPIGAILIGLLILVSWAANAFEHVWLLVGKSAPNEFISKLIYLVLTHDTRIQKVDTVSVSASVTTLLAAANFATVPSVPCWAALLCGGGYCYG
jgi:divalent metal cation (Fe/Co/Zn/Cd) transporter